MTKISVIMPVYNTEQYINRAINSVINQTHQNWELIIIDDGSTDNSLHICQNFALQDNRIFVLHKENGGQGQARNYAISKCTGEYVMYLDSDDWIDSDTMEFLLNAIKRYDADVVECGCRSVSNTGVIEDYINKDTIILNAKQCIQNLLASTDAVGPGACSKLIKYDLIANKFFPEIRAYEDFQFIFDVCVDVKKYVHVYEPKWNYFHRENSTMTAAFSLKRIGLIEAQKGICDILNQRGYGDEFYTAQKILCSKQFFLLYQLDKHYRIEDSAFHYNRIKNDIIYNYNEYMKNPKMGMNKLMLFMLRYLPECVWMSVLKLKFRGQ